jgi:hypothetical protein
MRRIGIAISGGPNPAEIIDLVVLAENLGYESAWVAEGHGGDQFAILAACAMRTSRIVLGTSISSVRIACTLLLRPRRRPGEAIPRLTNHGRLVRQEIASLR